LEKSQGGEQNQKRTEIKNALAAYQDSQGGMAHKALSFFNTTSSEIKGFRLSRAGQPGRI
jgi:hypothetical protein